jgi:hypothetical protein
MPAISKLQRGARGLVVLGLTLDDDDARHKSFIARRSPGFMVVKPNPAFNRDYGALLGLKGNRLVTPDKLIQANLPTWILIDGKGRIAAIHKSSGEENQVVSEAARLTQRS